MLIRHTGGIYLKLNREFIHTKNIMAATAGGMSLNHVILVHVARYNKISGWKYKTAIPCHWDKNIELRLSTVRTERDLSKEEMIRLCVVGDVRKVPFLGQCIGIPLTFEQITICYYGLFEESYLT